VKIQTCVLLAFLITALPVSGAPMISEFQADNADTITDEDGATSDWIEIYNPDDTAVSLKGMSITDDPLLPRKWVFPGVSLPAKGRLLVWASAKDRINPAAPLHTNFNLAAAGEYLALVAADGTTRLTEFNNYPPQPKDRSYGSTHEITVVETLVASGAACKWLVPTAAVPNWQTTSFNDNSWTSAATGIGYDTVTSSGVDYLPHIGAGGNTQAQMFNLAGRTSCYIRVPFDFTAAAGEVISLKLRMKYDDGFAAFLNGTRINPPLNTATNAPASLQFNSAAPAGRSDALAEVFETHDISSQRNLLATGVNVLALQVLNQASTSGDLLIVPEVEVTRVVSIPEEGGYFAVPTPGAANRVAPVEGFVDDPEFSTDRGFFAAPFALTLVTDTPQAVIRYTTDGSPPTATTGTLYTVPIPVSTTTVIRAAAFRNGWQPSKVDAHTYVFAASVRTQPAAPAGFPDTWGYIWNQSTGLLDPILGKVAADYLMDPAVANLDAYSHLVVPALSTSLPVVSLSGSMSDIFGIEGIYSNGRVTENEIPAGIEFFDPNSSDEWATLAGLRIHGGNAPIEHPKKPFRVYFRKRYGGVDRLRTSLYPGSPVDEFDVLQLRPGGHDGWAVPFGNSVTSLAYHATYSRDQFLRQTERDMGRLSPAGRYVHLYINGLYWGVYNLHETPNAEYFASHLGGADDEWDVVQNPRLTNEFFAMVDGTPNAFNDLLALIPNVNNPGVYEQIQSYLDIDAFIDHLIVQMWSAQNDWMGPVFRPPGNTDASWFFNKNWDGGRRSRGGLTTGFYFNCWDGEIAMGASLNLSPDTQRTVDFNHTLVGTPRAGSQPGPPAVIYHGLRQNLAFRSRFGDRLQKHFFNGGAMTVANNQARLQSIRSVLELPIVAESIRWGDVNRVDFTRDSHWVPEMDWLRDSYLTRRNDILLNQFKAITIFSPIAAPEFSRHGGSVPSDYQLSITDRALSGGTIYYTLDGTDPMGTLVEGTPVTLVGPALGTMASYKVPSEAYTSNSWKNVTAPWEAGVSPAPPGGRTPAQELATWSQGPVGFGFDADPAFRPHIATTVTGMQGVNPSLYVRIPFSVTAEQKTALTSLTLRLKYDDGAFVFLNGSVPLHRINAPVPAPAYRDTATTARADTAAVAFESFDLTPHLATLTVGSSNLLAIQGLNITAADEDFLCVPELSGSKLPTAPPSGSAISYSGPFILPRTGTVKARVLKNGIWSPLLEASFIVGQTASSSNLVISEFNYNPVASPAELLAGYTSQMFEWMELMNVSADPVELTGCRFDDGITFNFTNHSSVQILAPGARILLASNAAAFAARHPGLPIAGTFQGGSNLSNGGERLELIAASGAPIFDFVYDDMPPWPASADGQGHSLVLMSPLSAPNPALAANWRASIAPGGTPGASDADSFAAWAGRNFIPGAPGDDPDGNGLSSLAEYGLGLMPSSTETDGLISAMFETVNVAGTPDTYLVLRCRRNAAADDVIVTPEMSTDMVTWTPLTDSVPPENFNPDGTRDLARRSPQPVSAGARAYVRVSVTAR